MELIVLSISNILCFFIGAKIGQKVVKNEKIELPTINPVKIAKEHKESKETAKIKETELAILKNIDNYDGTGLGQEDIPG